MRYLLILLSFWALTATAQDMGKPTQVIEVWDNTTAPHSNELTEPTIIQNSRPRFTTETRIYLYTPAKGKHNGRGVVICPGGGYQHLSMENEGARMAEWFAAHGYVAAVLHYRMPNSHPEVPLEDACQAIRLLRGKVEGILPEWQVQTVGIVGSSAGGHLAAMTSTMGEERPDFTLLFYPVISAGAQRQHKGSFDRLLGEQRTPEQSDIYSEPILATACRLAEESIVMLKNEGGVLPIVPEKVKRVLVVGPMADAPYDQMGTWALDGDKTHTVTPIAAMQQEWGEKVQIEYIPCLTHPRDKSTAEFKKMKKAARKADVVVAFVGEEQMMSGEAHSLSSLDLQGAQAQMLEALAEVDTPLVTVFLAGRPLTIARQVEISDAILYAWHPGTMGGQALSNIIFGKANPSGKLPVTFPRNVGQIPLYYNHKHTSHRAKGTEGNLDNIPREAYQSVMGHTSSYLDVAPSPLFHFGYGLSYTTFELSDIKIENTAVTAEDTIRVSIVVTNTGEVDGTEVVQLYTGRKTASVTQPMKELKGFQRVTLKAGESRRVEFELPVGRLAFHNRDMVLAVEEGKYTLWLGTDCQNGLKTYFKIIK